MMQKRIRMIEVAEVRVAVGVVEEVRTSALLSTVWSHDVSED